MIHMNRKISDAVGLSDDIVALILDYVTNRDDRTSFSEVCKQWLRVEGSYRSEIRIIRAYFLPLILPRFPNLIVFRASSKAITNEHLTLLAQTCPNLELVNLNMRRNQVCNRSFPPAGNEGLRALADGCPKLCTLMLRGRKRITYEGVVSLLNSAADQNLTHLDLGYCICLTDRALEAIGKLRSLRVLILELCPFITDMGLGFLCNASCSKTLKKLVLHNCHRITDSGYLEMYKMSCLEELDLANTHGPDRITDRGGFAISKIQTLKRLNMSGQKVTNATMFPLAENCLNLEELVFKWCEVSRDGYVAAFRNHKSYKRIRFQLY